MFANTTKSIQPLCLIFILTASSAALAHPEMDRFGRDISGGLPAASVDLAGRAEVTGSITTPDMCNQKPPADCPSETAKAKPVRVRPDY